MVPSNEANRKANSEYRDQFAPFGAVLSCSSRSSLILVCTGPDSANGRASASGAGGCGFDPGPCHTKGIKNGTSGYLAWRSAL